MSSGRSARCTAGWARRLTVGVLHGLPLLGGFGDDFDESAVEHAHFLSGAQEETQTQTEVLPLVLVGDEERLGTGKHLEEAHTHTHSEKPQSWNFDAALGSGSEVRGQRSGSGSGLQALSHLGVWLLVKEQLEGVGLRRAAAVQAQETGQPTGGVRQARLCTPNTRETVRREQRARSSAHA